MLKAVHKKGDIVTVIMTNGVEVLGRFEEINDQNELVIRKPSQLFVDPKQGNLGLTPWVISAEVLTLKAPAVAAIGITDKSIADSYMSSTSDIALLKKT